MNCPKCGSPAPAKQTIPADRRPDGLPYRFRRCSSEQCGTTFTTREITGEALAKYQAGEAALATPPTPAQAAAQSPLPTPAPVGAQLIDLESEMEKLLPEALTALRESVKEKEPSRARCEIAWKIVSDRREYRRALAAPSPHGDPPEGGAQDPAMAQLANILRLVPDPELVEA